MPDDNYFSDMQFVNVQDQTFPYRNRKGYNVMVYSPDLFSIEMIDEGEVILCVENECRLLRAPVIFCTGGNSRYFYFKHTAKREPYRHLWVDFKGARGRRMYESLYRRFPDGIAEISPQLRISIQAVFRELYQSFHDHFELDYMVFKMEQLMYLLLSANSRKYEDSFQLGKLYDQVSQQPLLSYDVADLASERNISAIYLRKLFHERYGIPIGKFILKKRMEAAAFLLLNDRYRVGEVSDLCGFSNVSAFTRAFRSAFGSSPREFKTWNAQG